MRLTWRGWAVSLPLGFAGALAVWLWVFPLYVHAVVWLRVH